MARSDQSSGAGIVGYGAYVPYFRLDRKAISTTLGMGGGRGSRSVASYDEDTTSMGAEAARMAMKSSPGVSSVDALLFATSAPAYLDKTNANAVHAALGLPGSVFAADLMRSGSLWSGRNPCRGRLASLDACGDGRLSQWSAGRF